LLFLFLSLPLQAQVLNFQYYDATTGFPSRRVWSIYQEADGRIWFGDVEGALRYDGVQYDLFQERHGLPGAPVLAIHQMGSDLYFGTPNGLARFQSVKAETVQGLPITQVRAIESKDEILWVGTGTGLFMGRDSTFKHYLQDEDIRCIRFLGDRLFIGTYMGNVFEWQFGVTENEAPLKFICNLQRTVRGIEMLGDQLYAGCNNGLFKVEEGRPPEFIELIAGDRVGVSKLLADDEGGLWIGTWGHGLVHYVPTDSLPEISVYGLPNGLPSPFVTDLLVDSEKNIWISFFNGGVVKWSDRRFKLFPVKGQQSITRLNVDSKNTKWFTCSEFGLMKLEDGHNEPEVVLEDIRRWPTYSLYVDSKDQVWTIQPERLILLRDSESTLVSFPSNARKGAYRWMFEGPRGRMFFGGTRGLAVYKDGQLVDITPQEDERKAFWHYQIWEDGTIVFSSTTRLWILEDDTFRTHPFRPGMEQEVQSLLALPDHTLLVGTRMGLFKVFEDGTFKLFPETSGFNVSRLHVDHQNRTWAGSRSGIWELQDNRALLRFTPTQTMGRIENILQDASDHVWFVTHNVNVIYDGSNWVERRFPTGLTIQTFNPIPTDGQGNNWFATNRGLLSFTPDNREAKRPKPTIQICYLEFPDQQRIPVKADQTIKLPLENNEFTLHYRSHSFINEHLNAYRLELSGKQSLVWQGNTSQREFMNLASGSYQFRLTSINALNKSSSQPFQFSVIIQPPLWKTLPFITVISLLVLIAIYLLFTILQKRKVRALENRTNWLETQLKIKTESLLEAEKKATASAMTVTLSDEISQPLMLIQSQLDHLKQGPVESATDSTAFSQIQKAISRIRNAIARLRELDGIHFEEYTPGIQMLDMQQSSEPIPSQGSKPNGLLFVDDEEDLLEVWKAYFEVLGYSVHTALSVDKGIELLNAHGKDIQIIISDNKMPGKTGYDFFKATRDTFGNIPFFILTGYDVEVQLRDQLQNGLQGIIQKPITLEKLHEILKPCLSSNHS